MNGTKVDIFQLLISVQEYKNDLKVRNYILLCMERFL